MMPAQIPDVVMTAAALPSATLAGVPASSLTQHLRLAEMLKLRAAVTPLQLHLHGANKRPLSMLHNQISDEEERRKRRREKNKVAAARCRNKKKERTDFLQKESERLELLNAGLKSQIEDLKQEKQHLSLMLNLHRPTCIVRRPSAEKSPQSTSPPPTQ